MRDSLWLISFNIASRSSDANWWLLSTFRIQWKSSTVIPTNVYPGSEDRTEIVEVSELSLPSMHRNTRTRMLWRSATFAAIRLEMRGSRQPISLRDYVKWIYDRYNKANAPEFHPSLREWTQKLDTEVILGQNGKEAHFLLSVQVFATPLGNNRHASPTCSIDTE